MINLQNLHTHSTYCDGKDTPEQMVNLALDKGFESIGFSGHSYMFFSPDWSMSVDGTEEYKSEVKRLKKAYEDKIKIFLGLEVEMYSQVDLTGYDYLIGSLHYVKKGEQYLGFDHSLEKTKNIISDHFGGDGEAFALEYFRQFTSLPQYGKFDIIGHFDLITKYNEIEPLFDSESKAYLNAAKETLDAFKGKIPFFEVNTGAIARGYRTTPYPQFNILKEMKNMGFGAVISSDCHDGRKLDCHFEEARELLAACGFKERYILTESGFKAVAL